MHNKTPTPPQKESAFLYNKPYKLSVGYLYGLLVANLHDALFAHNKGQGTLQGAILHYGKFITSTMRREFSYKITLRRK